MTDELIIYLNGKFVRESQARISVFDQGVLFGDGVFEGIRVYAGRIFKCAEHVDRFFSSAKAIMLDLGLSRGEVTEVIAETCNCNDITDGYVRLVATRGIGDLGLLPHNQLPPTLFCIAGRLSLYDPAIYETGMPIITASQRRTNPTVIDPQIKSLNYLNNILAKIEAVRSGVPEALMLTEDGIVAECTGENVFIVKEGTLLTPPCHVGILNGITRQTIIQLAANLGMRLQEKEFTLFNVYSADECFLTGTAAEIVPVSSVDGREIGSIRPGPVTRQLTAAFREQTRTSGLPVSEG
ncbi:MAG: branched-chain-amino-acid transaminase [Candidatus Aminicenantes bacterium RBG_16_63_16]|nr:MAG: branched-chain-amino-acid transaminase [Candidatus Aminicenantes bacterium RBG_16_63_16]